MNYIKMAIALIALTASSAAQAPEKMSPGKPNLSDSFSKTGLKALLAIGDFKGTGSLMGPAKDAFEDARATANSARPPETQMITDLTNFAIMRSADNLLRENIMQKAAAKAHQENSPPSANLLLETAQKDPELSASLNTVNKRESECLTALEKAFRNRVAIPLPGMCAQ